MLEVMWKTFRSIMEVMVMNLGKKSGVLHSPRNINIIVENILLKKRARHLVTYESDSSKTQVDYCLARKG